MRALGRYLSLTVGAFLFTPAIASSQTVTAVWDANPTTDQVSSYEVCVSTTPLSCNIQRATVPAPQTTYVFAPTPGVLNRVAVRAISASGAGNFSTEVPVSIPAIAPIANRTSTVNTAITPLTVAVTDPDNSPLTFSHTGLPFGLTLNPSTGVISGTPTSTGSYNVGIIVNDGLIAASTAFVWTIQSGSSDAAAPAVAITSHTPGQTVTTSSITLAGTASDAGTGDSGISSVRVNGVFASGGTASGSGTATWSRTVSLVNGANTLTVIATDGAGNARTSQLTISLAVPDTSAPSLSITSHTQGQAVNAASITLGGTATDSGAGGSGITRVTINGTQATGTATGSNTTVWSGSVALQPGSNAINVVATDGAGNSRQLPIAITYNAPLVVNAVSSSPGSGSGTTQTFSLQYSDTSGATDLSSAWVWFNSTFSATSGNSCLLRYTRSTGTLSLLNDSQVWISGTMGFSGTLQNAQCAVSLAGSTSTTSGNTLTLNLPMTFMSGYAGVKNIYMYAANGANVNSGWQTRGTWTVPGSAAAVTADSASPDAGSGTTQTFALKYSDPTGGSNLSTAWVWFNAAFTSASANSCLIHYNRTTSTVLLLNDASAWTSGALSGGSTLQNSQCAINLAGSSASVSGNTLTLNLAMTFKSTYAGAKNIYMYASNASNMTSGWQARGTWTVPGVGGPTVTADSATPNAGSGPTQTFALKYSDTAGATDLAMTWVWFSSSFAPTSTNSCLIYYHRPTATLYLLNDGQTWLPGALGAATSLQNSQCSIDLAASTVSASANTLTLNLAVTFKPTYAGTKNIYMYAANSNNVISGWQYRGTWTAQ